MYYCNLIGKPCLKQECKQYSLPAQCALYRRIGDHLHSSQTEYNKMIFIKYLDEVRPTVTEG